MTFRLKPTAAHGTPEIDVAELDRLSEHPDGVQIVDVREPEEWAEGHIPGAIHIPLGDLAHRTGELDSGRPVVTICRSGRRSLTAVDTLTAAGFRQAASLAGGMIDWSTRHGVARN